MKVEVYLTLKHRDVSAKGIYDGTTMTVLPGGRISPDFADHIRGGNTAKSLRDNREFVDKTGRIIKECVFSSPSTAAQFVTGRSTNGFEIWKVENKKSLGHYLKEKGLR